MFVQHSETEEALAIRAEILERVRAYFAAAYSNRPFEAGVDGVPVSGRVFDERELVSLVDSSLDFWLTTGRFAEQFELE
jgi:CDP-6-deoxy-D-xylo-4-hexulose-3-dehydrase